MNVTVKHGIRTISGLRENKIIARAFCRLTDNEVNVKKMFAGTTPIGVSLASRRLFHQEQVEGGKNKREIEE